MNFYTCAVDDVTVAPTRIAHAVFMSVGLGFLLPLGMAVARFCRSVPAMGPKPFWFWWHWRIQTAAVVCAIIGFCLALAFVTQVCTCV